MKLIQACVSIFLIFILGSVVFAEQSKRSFTYDGKNKRDPFSMLVTKEGRILSGIKPVNELDTINLEGVMLDGTGNSLAIINGNPVKETDRIGEMQVLKIKAESVIMQKEGKVFVIYLKKGGKANAD